MDWFDEALKLYNQGLGYKNIAKRLNKPVNTVSNRFAAWKKRNNIPVGTHVEVSTSTGSIAESILKDLQKECSFKHLCDKYKLSERVLRATLDDIKDAGYILTEINGNVKLCKDIVSMENVHTENWEGDKIIRFGVVSDCHLGSKWQQLTFLNHLYDIFQAEGITTVYNCGDIVDGYKMHPGHEYEVFRHGADEQAEYVIEVYPQRPGVITKFITGNHDHSHIKNGGVDIGKRIADKRPDMVYLGLSNVKVNLTPNCTVELNHPIDGAAYALSYAPQKTIDAMSGGEKPNILLNGHHHKIFDMVYRNVQCYEAGTTCAQTPWMRGKRIAANIGGWIIELHVSDDGTITRCKDEKILLYKPIEHDY